MGNFFLRNREMNAEMRKMDPEDGDDDTAIWVSWITVMEMVPDVPILYVSPSIKVSR